VITPGEVRSVRELREGVQAEVCLGASVQHGSAVVRVEARSPEVKKALSALKVAISVETEGLLAEILKDQQAWDAEKANGAQRSTPVPAPRTGEEEAAG
jgi:hypothetical protein